MGIYSIFLDKDMYFDKGCSINGRSFNNLAEFVKDPFGKRPAFE